MDLWLIILGMGLVTYGIRVTPIVLLGRFDLPPLAWRALRYVPPAVLTAIIFPEALMRDGAVALWPLNARLVAALVAAVVAWRTKSVIWTIAVGMAVFWVLQALS